MRAVTLSEARAEGKWPDKSCVGCPFAPRTPLVSFKVMLAGFVACVILCAGYSTYAIEFHAHQACTELRILAKTGGAATRYDLAVSRAYGRLYSLRCG